MTLLSAVITNLVSAQWRKTTNNIINKSKKTLIIIPKFHKHVGIISSKSVEKYYCIELLKSQTGIQLSY